MKKPVFFVGDVHGCFSTLKLLLKKAQYKPNLHRLILLGDLINKGPDSFAVLSWVRENKITALLGNHELKFIQAVETGEDLNRELSNKISISTQFKQLKQSMGQGLENWLSYLKSWPVYIEEKNFIALHGGLVPGEHPKQSKTTHLVNIRYWNKETKEISDNPAYPAWHDLYTGSKLVVYAHWARQGLKIKSNSIGLDTGCVYGGKLTGLWLPDRKIVQTPCVGGDKGCEPVP